MLYFLCSYCTSFVTSSYMYMICRWYYYVKQFLYSQNHFYNFLVFFHRMCYHFPKHNFHFYYDYRYIQYEEVSDTLTKRIDDAVRKARMREEWRSEYMKGYLREYDVLMDGVAIGRTEGLQEGISIGRIQESIESAIEYGIARKDVITKLIKKFELTEEKANELYDKYANS